MGSAGCASSSHCGLYRLRRQSSNHPATVLYPCLAAFRIPPPIVLAASPRSSPPSPIDSQKPGPWYPIDSDDSEFGEATEFGEFAEFGELIEFGGFTGA
ncbi:hypothetical protein ABW19_dt0207888 [Dactylella cylindrospora]|nr:hypothetical protein ABW19_dt0207888 [Dactylella cylindrospora]